MKEPRPVSQQSQEIMDLLSKVADIIEARKGTLVVGFIVDDGNPILAIQGDPLYQMGMAAMINAEGLANASTNPHYHPRNR